MEHFVRDERFWSNVDMSGGPDACWPWKRRCETNGYGRVTRNYKPIGAHRYAWAQGAHLLAPPPEWHIRHTCDNPPCCNPAHLIPGTAKDNMADCVERGRRRGGRRNGEVHPRSKLTDAQVAELRNDRDNGMKVRELAEKYGISLAQASKVSRGVSRAEETKPETVRLTAAQIIEIRASRAAGETLTAIAARHGVPVPHVSHVVLKRGYK